MHTSVRILQIGPYPPPGTGWSVRIKMLKRHLERAGHVCAVLNTNKNRRTASADFVPILHGWDYLRKVVHFCARGYLVHMHINGKSTKSPVLALIAEFVSLLFRRRAVVTFHAGPVQDYFPKQNKFWIDQTFRLIFRMAGKIVCNSEEVKARIVEYGIAPEKIVPIPAFCPQYLEDRAELRPPLTDFIRRHQVALCTYVYLRPDFNLEFLLRALQQFLQELPGLGVVWMGADRETDRLGKQLRQYGLERNSHLAGDLDHGEFLAVLAACQVYVRTPVVDGVSSSVLEALMLGTKVVASENGARPPGVITYQDGELDSFHHALRHALGLKSGVVSPEGLHRTPRSAPQLPQQLGVRDTLREEIELLCRHAS